MLLALMPSETRGCLGMVYRITAEFLEKRGLKEEVTAQLPPALRRFVEKPPFPFSWQEYSALEEIEKALYDRGSHLAADLGFAAAENLSGTLVAPVFKMAVSLFGGTPDELFRNLDRFFAIVVRGFTFRYEPGGARDGRVIVQIAGGPVHESLFQQLKGNLRIMYNLCGATGTVGEPSVLRSDGEGAEVALRVSWFQDAPAQQAI